MRQLDLPVFVREQESLRALQHAEPAALKTRRVSAAANSFAARFHADHAHRRVVEKRMKKTDRVAPAADAGDEHIRQTLFAFQNLPARFDPDHAMKIAHHHRIRMRAERGAEDVMRRAHVRDPIAHRFVDRFFQRRLAGGDGDDFRAQKTHPRNVERLAFHIDRAHVDDAFAAEPRGHRGGRDAVLAGAGFGDDPLLAHAPREQDLAERVVDFVRAGVEQVFAFQINFRAAELLRQALGEIKRRRPAGEIAQQMVEFGLKIGIFWRVSYSAVSSSSADISVSGTNIPP